MLYFGAHWLVKGSSSLAQSLGITPIMIGLTIVAFGTSAPELFISIVSSVKGKSMIAVGNVVGSNICNIALVLGLSSLIHPIKSSRSVVRRDIPIMLGITVILLTISFNSLIGRLEGVFLVAGFIIYICFNYYTAINEFQQGKEEENIYLLKPVKDVTGVISKKYQIIYIVVGIAGVVAGAEILVDSAVLIMKIFGVSEKFIGLTIVALGTSLPELATSVVAALRKEMDISLGNLVGSNVFNILCVIGASSIVRPIPIPGGFFNSGLFIDYMVMMLISILPWVMMRKDCVVSRKSGVVLLSCYITYVIFLIFKS